MKLTESEVNARFMIQTIGGSDIRLLNKLTSVGLTRGTKVQVLKNDKKMPVQICADNTMLTLNRTEAERIEVKRI